MIDTSGATTETRRAPEDAHDWRRMAERVKRDHAAMRALVDDLEHACRVVEELHPGSRDRFRQAAWSLYVAFDEHLATEDADFAPILRTADAWGDLRVANMAAAHDEQRRVILDLVEGIDGLRFDAAALVGQARGLVVSFRADMDSEENELDEEAVAPTVVSDQEDG